MSVGWARRGLSVIAGISIVASLFVLPAGANKDGDQREDKGRGIATVESYDAATNQLVLATKHFGTVTVTVAEDARIGVIQQGQGHRKSGFGLGTEADLVPGAVVLNSRAEEGLITKVMLFLPKVDDGDNCDEAEDRTSKHDDDCDEADDDDCEEPDDGDDPVAGSRTGDDGEHEEDEADDGEDEDDCPDVEVTPEPTASATPVAD